MRGTYRLGVYGIVVYRFGRVGVDDVLSPRIDTRETLSQRVM